MIVRPAFSYREGDRKAFVDGLRELANFLVLNSSLPVPLHGSVTLNVIAETDANRRSAVNRIARLLKADLDEDEGAFRTVRRFGPVEYRCWASTLAGDAAWKARTSYDDSIQP